ncbi:hypothetical protein G6F56_011497 [Rhizopus delemar]|nr:hypothetical protein G6F56_011497 [Rhizopus delemar]
MCIYSFRLYRPEYISDADIRHAQSHNMPLMGPALPQPAMTSNPAYPPDRSVIVLNNQKPSKKKSKFDSFSFRNIKRHKSVEPTRQFTISYKNDGHLDLESAYDLKKEDEFKRYY